LNVKKERNLIAMKYAIEDYRRHQTEAEEQRLLFIMFFLVVYVAIYYVFRLL
jgi:hypothetical protein